MQTDEPADFTAGPPGRSRFLTILCILTFVGSGYNIVNGLISYLNAEQLSGIMAEKKGEILQDANRKSSPETENFVKSILRDAFHMTTPENIRKTAISNAVSSLFCLLGALLMWRLRRTGFYLYILGTLAGILLPFYFFGQNFITQLTAAFIAFIGLMFVIFYAMNLKSMK